MILKTESKEQYQAAYKKAFDENYNIFYEAKKTTLRKMFDECRTDWSANSIINLTRQSGYGELAAEMEIDLLTETAL